MKKIFLWVLGAVLILFPSLVMGQELSKGNSKLEARIERKIYRAFNPIPEDALKYDIVGVANEHIVRLILTLNKENLPMDEVHVLGIIEEGRRGEDISVHNDDYYYLVDWTCYYVQVVMKGEAHYYRINIRTEKRDEGTRHDTIEKVPFTEKHVKGSHETYRAHLKKLSDQLVSFVNVKEKYEEGFRHQLLNIDRKVPLIAIKSFENLNEISRREDPDKYIKDYSDFTITSSWDIVLKDGTRQNYKFHIRSPYSGPYFWGDFWTINVTPY